MGFATAKQEEDSQVVLLLQILAHEVNYGYGSRNCLVVDAFNGEKILNIRSWSPFQNNLKLPRNH